MDDPPRLMIRLVIRLVSGSESWTRGLV